MLLTWIAINTIAEYMKKKPDSSQPATRKTRQRQLILDELRKRRDHPTAEEIHAGVRRILPSISLGTIYRNLEFLADRGEIRRIECSGKAMRFDGNLAEHQHAVCLGCGRIEDIEGRFELPPMPEAGTTGISIIWARIVYEGFCRQCSLAAREAEKGENV